MKKVVHTKHKIHLQGATTTLCGRDTCDVITAYTLREAEEKGTVCETCRKLAKDFQKVEQHSFA